MQEIKTVIRSPYEPNDVHALWIDTSNIDSPIVKVHENGKWQGIGGDGGGSSSEETEIPADGFAPNTFYNLGTITENTTFLMAEGEEGKANHYFWVFETGADVPEITWPEGIRMWKDNMTPEIAANQHYEISVYDGVALYIAIEMPDVEEP